MAIRTKALGVGSSGTANVTVTMYTCPVGHTAIVKSIWVSNGSGSAASLILAANSGPVFVNLHVGSLAATSGVVQLEPYLVLEPGDSVVVNCSIANAAKYWVSGQELLGVA